LTRTGQKAHDYVKVHLMRFGYALLWVGLAGGGAWAQSVISAHSGVVHYIEGDVAIDGSEIHPRFAEFPDLKNGQVLATEEGRAEILLTPGVFLRLAENSSVRMISNSLSDTHLQVVSGTAMVEAGELLPGNAISFDCAGARIALPKKGLYAMDANAAKLRVYDGQALVSLGDQQVTARKSHEIALDGETLADSKFDIKDTDPFYRWNARRAEYIADANLVAARVQSNSSYTSGYTDSAYNNVGYNGGGSWNWNPYFGMFTYLPANGMYVSPFGSMFYSPGMVSTVYIPQRSNGAPTVVSGTAATSSAASAGPVSHGISGISHGGGGGHVGGGHR
jgi:hypothetical protein